MKTTAYFFSVVVMLVVQACMRPMSESESDLSAGLNGSFETVKHGLPVNWLVYTPATTGSDFDLLFDTRYVKDGKQSLKFSVRKCSGKGGRYSPGLCREIEVVPGAAYTVRFGPGILQRVMRTRSPV